MSAEPPPAQAHKLTLSPTDFPLLRDYLLPTPEIWVFLPRKWRFPWIWCIQPGQASPSLWSPGFSLHLLFSLLRSTSRLSDITSSVKPGLSTSSWVR